MSIKNMDDFVFYIVANIEKELGNEYKGACIEITDVVKNNDMLHKALIIKKQGSPVAPSIYLDGYFERYKKGFDIDAIVSQIAEARKGAEKEDKFDISLVCDWEKVKTMVVPRVIGLERNARYLSDRPYDVIADLAVVYSILLNGFDSEDGVTAITVTDELFRKWDISFIELKTVAIENMRRELKPTFRGLGDVIGDMLGEGCPAEFTDEINDTISVISNAKMCHGASAILDTDFMHKIHTLYGGDIYIIPASIHELLVLGASDRLEVDDLLTMIRQVNDNEVKEEEILSYNLYKYSNSGLEVVKAEAKASA